MSDVFLVIIPIVVILVILKLCLVFWRVWLYQKRRQQRLLMIQQQRMMGAPAQARVVAVRRVIGPDGMAQQTAYAITRPGCPPRQVTRTIIVRPASGRPLDPNLPPTYQDAVTGKDRSVKVEEGGVTSPPPRPGMAAPATLNPSPFPPPTQPSAPPQFPSYPSFPVRQTGLTGTAAQSEFAHPTAPPPQLLPEEPAYPVMQPGLTAQSGDFPPPPAYTTIPLEESTEEEEEDALGDQRRLLS